MRAKLPHTEGKISRDGVDLHYEIYGHGAHTILFVPTWAIIHSRCWKAQIPYFSDHFRVIAFDPRGNGKSDRPSNREDYAFDKVVHDVIAVMDATDTEKATLVGLSFSSAVSFAVAAYFPERVSAVISTGAYSPIVPPYEERARAYERDMAEKPVGWEKYNPDYWLKDYPDFVQFFMSKVHNEPHSTKQQEDAVAWALDGDGEMLRMTMEARGGNSFIVVDEEMYRRVKCPCLIFVGDNDEITPPETSYCIAELTGGELVIVPGGGHGLHGRFPAFFNTTARDFLSRHLGTYNPKRKPRPTKIKRALYLSSPIGLGHARRDLSVTRELRKHHPDLQVDWLAQDPVTRFLDANAERIFQVADVEIDLLLQRPPEDAVTVNRAQDQLDHDRTQCCEWESVEKWKDEKQCQQYQPGIHQGDNLGPSTGPTDHHPARKAATHDEAGTYRRSHICHTERQQFLVGIDILSC